jgi:putative heme transporter
MAADQRRRLAERQPPEDEDLLPDEDPSYDDRVEDEPDEDEEVGRLQALLSDRRRLAIGALAVVVVVIAIYVLLPNLVGAGEAVENLDDAVWYWVVAAVGFNVLAFAAYVALFRGILGGTHDDAIHRRLDAKASYQITMAGLAATRIFSAGGAGGIALTYWALRKAGMPRRRSACRMVSFLVLTYSIYLIALVVFGILLRTHVLPGPAPVSGTIVPAALAAAAMGIFLLIALIPKDFERRIQQFAGGYRRVRYVQRLAKGPATLATGTRTALAYIRHPRRGALALGGAVGFWGANIAVLWASFKAFGGEVSFGVLVQGFFVGMAANLIPSPAGGVGSVDAGMIFAFDVLFGMPSAVVFPAVLTYRVIAFWLPIPPGIVAFFQLRGTVAKWERERELTRVAGTTLQKVKY